jgi:alpha-tubulin suppressor-like RCC1 family protein
MAIKRGEPLIQRLKKLSRAELESRDVFGRAVIHLICLLGRFDLLEALLSNPQCQPRIQDYESRWTAFHYALFYGKLSCARLLLEHDSDLVRMKDRSGLTAMDIYHLQYSLCNLKIWPQSIGNHDTNYMKRSQNNKIDDPLIWWDKDTRGGSDIYTFGVNVNYQLGTGDADDKLKAPYKVEIDNLRLKDHTLGIADRLVKPRVKDFVISKNHSVLLTNEIWNNLLVAGNPSRGRLGSGSLIPNYKFKHVEYFSDEHVVAAAVSDDHTLALTSDGHVYSWGLNNYYQLGYQTEVIKDKPDTFSDVPKRVVNGLKRVKIKGVSCSKIHSCAYSGTSLILWGLNVGQMDIIRTGEIIGHGKLKGIVQHPRKIEFPHAIKQVIATEEATIVLLDTDECHILTSGNHLRFQIPLYKTLNNEFKFFRPTRFSKKKSIIKLVSKESTKIGILYDDGSVSNFGVNTFSKNCNIKYSEIWSPRNSHLKCIDVDIGRDGSIVIVTKSGCVYKRVARMNKSDFKFTKVERISKIVRVSCDSLFTSFGFIKDDVDQLPLDLFKNRFLVDVNSLSPLHSYTYGRKRAELVDTEAFESYSVNYLHKPDIEIAEDESQILQKQLYITKEDEDSTEDPVFNAYKRRWEFPQELKDTFQRPENLAVLGLTQESLHQFNYTSDTIKGFDTVLRCGGYRFGAHKNVLFLVGALRGIAAEDVVVNDIKFTKLINGVVDVKNMSPISLLILLNVLYTGRILRPWESTSEVKQSMRHVQHETLSVLKALGLADELNRCSFNVHERFGDREEFEDDVTIKLLNGEFISCWSVLLKARNAYFETLFSERWEGNKVLEFEHVRKDVFDVVLEYIYGHEQMTLLDHLEVSSIADFINFCFEIIELSDELLLFGLKDFAQLMIKDFITSENVLLILHHADSLDCQKLIGECLWFIYNNVDALLIDANYELLSMTVVERIDKYCRWVGKVNKVILATESHHWYEDNSDELLHEFLSSKRDFNDIFLSSDDFVPLFDIAPKRENKSPKFEPKKPKQPAPAVQLLSERRESAPSSTLQQPSFAEQLRKSSLQDSSAVEFTGDDFQQVVNRRRKSSSGRRGSSSTTAAAVPMNKLKSVSTNTPSKAIPMPQIYRHRNSSSGSIDQSGTSWFGHQNNSTSALSPMSNWASPGESSILSSPSSVTSWLKVDNNAGSPSSSKIIFGTTRLSQKERKKLMKSEAENTPSKSNIPWKIPVRSASNVNSPSIVSAQEEAMAAESAIPSLKGIMHEEEHMVIESQRSQAKSLAEIQQEEEFAQWWEEESRRVQQEMAGFAANRTTQGNAERSKQKPKKRYNRQYRKQSVP